MRSTGITRAVKLTAQTLLTQSEKEVTIKAPWGNIAGLTWGDPNDTPVFLCHGRMDVSSGFRPLIQRLPNNFFYVAIDVPGNGRSDHMPKGVALTAMDLTQSILRVKEHFGWSKFHCIGHSLGVLMAKIYHAAYPGSMKSLVELDPQPAYITFDKNEFPLWYVWRYGRFYEEDRYKKYNGDLSTAPKYTFEEVLNLTMKNRGLTKEAASHILERHIIKTDDNMYRFTYDQRMKSIVLLPFTPSAMQDIYTSFDIPILCILASDSVTQGFYDKVPFLTDEKAWPNGNYKYKIVEGGHDVHINNPDCLAEDVSEFLSNQKA